VVSALISSLWPRSSSDLQSNFLIAAWPYEYVDTVRCSVKRLESVETTAAFITTAPRPLLPKVHSDDLNIGAEQNLAIRFKSSIVVYTLTSVVVTYLMLEREQKPGRCWNIPLLIEALPSLT
jgi:hypothetical protein